LTDFSDRERPAFSSRPELPLPTEPPFTAHIGNLSFDATSSDVSELFADCEVTNVRIVEDKLNRSPKGFGYVEFASVEGLKKALTFSGTTLQGRGIRVSIAEPRMYFWQTLIRWCSDNQ
jgi:translation initiation factor 4B